MRLGKGLGAILEDAEASYLKDLPQKGVEEIALNKIEPNPYQPRKEFSLNSIKELANSIEKYGLMQPIVVIENNDKYILVSGERRYRAFQFLKRNKIKSLIVDYSLKQLREYALIENIQREELSPIEIALSLKNLMQEYNYTHQEVAEMISKSRTYVTNLLRILKLPKFVLDKIENNKLSIGHAKILIGLDEKMLQIVLKEIEENSLSVRETEQFVKKIRKKADLRVEKLVNKFVEKGFIVESGEKYIKIKFKNEKDLEKLEKLLSLIG